MRIDQGFETMEGASGDDWMWGAQSIRAYMRGADHRRPEDQAVLEATSVDVVMLVVKACQVRSPA